MAITKLVLSPVAQSKGFLGDDIKKATTTETTASSSPLARRRVSFDESQNVLHENLQWNRDDCRTHWHSKLDYQHMKETTRMVAKQHARRERRNADNVESYNNILLHVYDLCCNSKTEDLMLSEQDQALFHKAIGLSNSRFGIEKCCVRELAYDKRYRRGALVEVVSNIQAHYKEGCSTSRAQVLRRSSESLSRASRLFALLSAMALEASL